jgi:hypothetical protein
MRPSLSVSQYAHDLGQVVGYFEFFTMKTWVFASEFRLDGRRRGASMAGWQKTMRI